VSSSFQIHRPTELAFTRNVLFAAEIFDAVTLEPVTRGISVKATGLTRKPIINYSGAFVWLEEGNARPLQIVVDASNTPYESITLPVPAPPAKSMRIELAPRYDYPFTSGITALRGSLIERRTVSPVVAVKAAEVWLQWIDDNQTGTVWIDAPTRSHSRDNGDFATHLRLTPKQTPKTVNGKLRSRLRVRRNGITRRSIEFELAEGRVADRVKDPPEPFAWNELLP
jgi:hypothetical protein